MASWAYLRAKKDQNLEKQMMEAAINKIIPDDRNMLAVYHISIHLFNREEVFTTFGKRSCEIKIQDKPNKDDQHRKVYSKPHIKEGLLHELLCYMSGRREYPIWL